MPQFSLETDPDELAHTHEPEFVKTHQEERKFIPCLQPSTTTALWPLSYFIIYFYVCTCLLLPFFFIFFYTFSLKIKILFYQKYVYVYQVILKSNGTKSLIIKNSSHLPHLYPETATFHSFNYFFCFLLHIFE